MTRGAAAETIPGLSRTPGHEPASNQRGETAHGARREALLLRQSRTSRRGLVSAVTVIVLTTLGIFALLYLIWELRQLVQWLLIATFLAVAIYPVVRWMRVHGVSLTLAILTVYFLLLVALVGIVALLLPPLMNQFQGLAGYVIEQAQSPGGLTQAVERLADRFGVSGYAASLREQLAALPGQLSAAAGPLIAVVQSILQSLTALVGILVLAFFLLRDGDRFLASGLNLLSPAQQPRVRRILTHSARAVHGYVNGNLFISVIAGSASFIALSVMGIPYAVPLSLVVALFDLLPLVGAFIGSGLVILVTLTIDPLKAAALVAYFVVYQNIENHFLQPVVYGRSVKLHPLATFIAVLSGANLLGILGALIAIPVAEIIRVLISEWIATRRLNDGHTTEEVVTASSVHMT